VGYSKEARQATRNSTITILPSLQWIRQEAGQKDGEGKTLRRVRGDRSGKSDQKIMTKITAEEYRNMMSKRSPVVPETTTGRKEKKAKQESGKLTTQEALKAMGHYFELDEKSVKFWIRQQELSKKI
jgi:hypothetical protein